jgi:hypothetical protein
MEALYDIIADREQRLLLRWWLDARGTREMPARGDFDPLDHPDLLPRLFLVAVNPEPPHFRYRLCGTEIDVQQGYSMTARTFEELFSGELLRFTHERFFDTAFNRRISYHTTHFSNDNEAKSWRFTPLLLPLAESGARVDMILGSRVVVSGLRRSYAELEQDVDTRQSYEVAVVDAAHAAEPRVRMLSPGTPEQL